MEFTFIMVGLLIGLPLVVLFITFVYYFLFLHFITMKKIDKVKEIALNHPELIEDIQLINLSCHLKIKNNKLQWMGTGIDAISLFNELTKSLVTFSINSSINFST